MEKSRDAFRTISEVAEWLDVPTHVLRFWESRFSQIKPVKRAGGRRYYRPSDMALIGGIKVLLHDQGMTIRGVQKVLRESGIKHVAGFSPPVHGDEADDADDVIEATAVPLDAPRRPVSIPAPAASATREAEPAPVLEPLNDAPEAPEVIEESAAEVSEQLQPEMEPAAAQATPADDPIAALGETATGPSADDDQPDMFPSVEDVAAESSFADLTSDAPSEISEDPAPAAPGIPDTPDVPANDATDDDAGHPALPGLAARAMLSGIDVGHPAARDAATRLAALRARLAE
ncbi:MerR family transcriptional regulator [Alphaproteobacteria bacterium GH1-50]|uniref:MerR family transcriptional regulator n=1 Tax=Kangsaoukella pontilimi TaxID=2691042 RepID=A0A7C9IEV9_9RHOB|nr:MerR family transcriptional regulator [Kangsaoukella pontilimi]MXQ07084.1 MerR family transcriptional regulator [Kangsaoukella pontilimi]